VLEKQLKEKRKNLDDDGQVLKGEDVIQLYNIYFLNKSFYFLVSNLSSNAM
jgi:hypothetical protein